MDINYWMVTHDLEKSMQSSPKHKRKLGVSKYVNLERATDVEPINPLICTDCNHNSITYEPAKDGACSCGCH